MLKLLILERFLIDRMTACDRKALYTEPHGRLAILATRHVFIGVAKLTAPAARRRYGAAQE
ncbi:hypothetical protein [Methylocapsa palsarum]|uniref:hypothetical protein n=1 Tax=Methylocapsa palsarum TaxID=1612308 RepID=UPI000B82A279|nr:hypothetical protein [Methylocapsa palsarum]